MENVHDKEKHFCIALSCLIYQIWQTRNEVIWQSKVKSTDIVLKTIKYKVKARYITICVKEDDRDTSWMYTIIYDV